MLQIAQPIINYYHNFKCGEIFCISPAVYNVTCCLCTTKMHLEQFASHFQLQHLTLAEESINLEDLEQNRKAKLRKDSDLIDNVAVKEEDPEDDPIKQEEPQINEDKSLRLLIRETENIQEPQQQRDKESEEKPVSLGEKLEIDIIAHKPFTRYAKNLQTKAEIKPAQEKEVDLAFTEDKKQSVTNNTKENEIICHDIETDFKEHEDDDNDMDWSVEDKCSESESDNNKTNMSIDELPYPCLICKRSYRSKRSLQKHQYSVHNPNKPPKKTKLPKEEHKCDECNESFRSARDLRGHKWKHTGIFCDICGKPFTQTGNMMRHKIRHTGIKAHKCKDCGKEFFTDKELKSHLICHTGLMPVICEICGKPCRDRGVLTAHMRRHTGERPAKCEVCGKSFFSFHDLNVHAVTHSSERPFKCDICGSTFQRKKALRVHKLIHSKDRKHVCKICGKGFAQSGGLNSHMRTHDAALGKSATETAAILIPTNENQSTLSITTPTTTTTTNNIKVTNNIAEVSISQAGSNSNVLTGQYIV